MQVMVSVWGRNNAVQSEAAEMLPLSKNSTSQCRSSQIGFDRDAPQRHRVKWLACVTPPSSSISVMFPVIFSGPQALTSASFGIFSRLGSRLFPLCSRNQRSSHLYSTWCLDDSECRQRVCTSPRTDSALALYPSARRKCIASACSDKVALELQAAV